MSLMNLPRLLDDGFSGLSALGDGLKGRVRVQFIDEHGAAEAGVVRSRSSSSSRSTLDILTVYP